MHRNSWKIYIVLLVSLATVCSLSLSICSAHERLFGPFRLLSLVNVLLCLVQKCAFLFFFLILIVHFYLYFKFQLHTGNIGVYMYIDNAYEAHMLEI